MDKANVIISIIIVLCIAAAVTAYGITNTDNPIFSSLSGMGADDGNGIGNNTTLSVNNSSTTTAGSGSQVSNGGSSSGGSSSSSGSSSGGSSSSSGRSSSPQLSYASAKAIASDAVEEPGCYAGSGYYSGGAWHFTIYDANGNAVDSITVDDSTGNTGRG